MANMIVWLAFDQKNVNTSSDRFYQRWRRAGRPSDYQLDTVYRETKETHRATHR